MSFQEILSEYTKQVKAVIEVTLKAMGKLLDLEEDYFLKQFDDKVAAYARFNYYPRCSRPDLVHGLKPHFDDSRITILLPDQTVEGLEVCKDGKWVEVNVLPYALIINVGDQMEVMSNGMFKSPVHRAVANSVEDRISLVMFLVADAEKEIGPADGLIDEENGKPRLYKRFEANEYHEFFYHSYKQGKRAIHWAPDKRDKDNHILLILVAVAVGGESTIRGSRKTYFFVLYNTNICRKPLKRKLHYAHYAVASGLDLDYALVLAGGPMPNRPSKRGPVGDAGDDKCQCRVIRNPIFKSRIQPKKNQVNPNSGDKVMIKTVQAVQKRQHLGSGVLMGMIRSPVHDQDPSDMEFRILKTNL
ncbi:hypothetical protein ACLOJK_027631 [Asimina triloba]